mmetsp:Transcript_40244/g.101852  ORF Transcript_40244/g.101852 Transcript_40244/m.101852 type:complete len:320 (+) Transcript_40244:953-1912(+)
MCGLAVPSAAVQPPVARPNGASKEVGAPRSCAQTHRGRHRMRRPVAAQAPPRGAAPPGRHLAAATRSGARSLGAQGAAVRRGGRAPGRRCAGAGPNQGAAGEGGGRLGEGAPGGRAERRGNHAGAGPQLCAIRAAVLPSPTCGGVPPQPAAVRPGRRHPAGRWGLGGAGGGSAGARRGGGAQRICPPPHALLQAPGDVHPAQRPRHAAAPAACAGGRPPAGAGARRAPAAHRPLPRHRAAHAAHGRRRHGAAGPAAPLRAAAGRAGPGERAGGQPGGRGLAAVGGTDGAGAAGDALHRPAGRPACRHRDGVPGRGGTGG